MNINYLAVVVATVAEFAIGAIWYMPIFGKTWGKIHGMDKISKEEMKKMQAKMGPYYLAQVVVTAITTFVLAKLAIMLPAESIYSLALMGWAGFVVPTQVSGVIFGGTKPQWITKKIVIMAAGSLACLLAAAFILKAFN